MSDSDLGKLNKYMGGTDDAAQFTVTGYGKSSETEWHEAPEAVKARRIMKIVNNFRHTYELTFDQAMQLYLASVE